MGRFTYKVRNIYLYEVLEIVGSNSYVYIHDYYILRNLKDEYVIDSQPTS